MSDFKILVDSFLMSQVKGGFIAICVILAIVIAFAAVVTAIELKKQRGAEDAERPAVDDGKMPDSDDTH